MVTAAPPRSTVRPQSGPALLAGLEHGPGLDAHRAWFGPLPEVSRTDLVARTQRIGLRGRGGAGFPFSVKLGTAARGRRPVVVVNWAEGEPASAKDAVLAEYRPHLVLDGAAVAATALGAGEVHLMLPSDRPGATAAVEFAVTERRDRVSFRLHRAEPRFVAGQARAVISRMGRGPSVPQTARAPESVAGYRGRPTLLSNAETWAQLARLLLLGEDEYAAFGTLEEPGTTLLTLDSGDRPSTVVEVPFGISFRQLVSTDLWRRPMLLGGYHGTWMTPATWHSARVSPRALAQLGHPLGAGVVVLPAQCPVTYSTRVVSYLAGQSAGRCGPCHHGLPALASALAEQPADSDTLLKLADLVTGRGACAHPDGTARLVRSLATTFPGELRAHRDGECRWSR